MGASGGMGRQALGALHQLDVVGAGPRFALLAGDVGKASMLQVEKMPRRLSSGVVAVDRYKNDVALKRWDWEREGRPRDMYGFPDLPQYDKASACITFVVIGSVALLSLRGLLQILS